MDPIGDELPIDGNAFLPSVDIDEMPSGHQASEVQKAAKPQCRFGYLEIMEQ